MKINKTLKTASLLIGASALFSAILLIGVDALFSAMAGSPSSAATISNDKSAVDVTKLATKKATPITKGVKGKLAQNASEASPVKTPARLQHFSVSYGPKDGNDNSYDVTRYCDGNNLIYLLYEGSYSSSQMQVFYNVKQCGGSN